MAISRQSLRPEIGSSLQWHLALCRESLSDAGPRLRESSFRRAAPKTMHTPDVPAKRPTRWGCLQRGSTRLRLLHLIQETESCASPRMDTVRLDSFASRSDTRRLCCRAELRRFGVLPSGSEGTQGIQSVIQGFFFFGGAVSVKDFSSTQSHGFFSVQDPLC